MHGMYYADISIARQPFSSAIRTHGLLARQVLGRQMEESCRRERPLR